MIRDLVSLVGVCFRGTFESNNKSQCIKLHINALNATMFQFVDSCMIMCLEVLLKIKSAQLLFVRFDLARLATLFNGERF